MGTGHNSLSACVSACVCACVGECVCVSQYPEASTQFTITELTKLLTMQINDRTICLREISENHRQLLQFIVTRV